MHIIWTAPQSSTAETNRYWVYAVDQGGTIDGDPERKFDAKDAAEQYIAQIGNSLDDFTGRIREAFAKKFNSEVANWWVPDVFENYLVAKHFEEGHWRVNFTLNENGQPEFAPRTDWERVIVDYRVVAETHKGDLQFTFVSELKGDYPDVPFAEGVDKSALEDGDESPMYLTLPVARVGATSKNKLHHTPEFVQSVVEQINAHRPGGIMGHIKSQDRGTAFPVSDIHWVGATLDNDGTAWAKGYIPRSRQDVREHYRTEKAKNGKAAISLYGTGERHQHKDGTWTPGNFQLEAVDLAPWQRAALALSGEFKLTSEMADEDNLPASVEPEETMDWNTIKLDDIPENVIEMVLNARQPEPVVVEPAIPAETVAELERLTGQVETLNTLVSELQGVNQALQQSRFEDQVDQIVAEYTNWNVVGHEDAESAVGKLRKSFKADLINTFTARVAELEENQEPPVLSEVAVEVWEEHKTIAEMVKNAIAGGSVTTQAKDRPRHNVAEPTEEEMKSARATLGI